MRAREFLQRRLPDWKRLEHLLEKVARRGLVSLSGDEIGEFGRLYRFINSDLAHAKAYGFEQPLQRYLNRLTARAYGYVYAGNAEQGGQRVLRFFLETFPREFRRSWAYAALCAALTLGSSMVAFAMVTTRPATAYALLPSNLIPAGIEKSLHDSTFAFAPEQSAIVSAEVITNNIRVASLAFAGGMTLGVVTLYVVLWNGIMLGTVAALFTNAGFGYDFWSTVTPHGVLELSAIQIAGGAGLLLTAGVLNPGRLRRRDALVLNGRRAAVLIVGVAAMLLAAGAIEGFFSPLRFAPSVRVAVGALSAAVLIAYLGFAGRPPKASRAA